MRRCCLLMALLVALAPAPSASAKPVLRMNQVQVVATHNSYKREITPVEQQLFEAAVHAPGLYGTTLAYSHAPLGQQFTGQGVRGLELDLWPDPQGGLYGSPLVRRAAGLPPITDSAWAEPGIKVMHTADLDYRTTCVRLTGCLREVRSWSRAHPRHVPIPVLLELKQSEPQILAAGGVTAPPWDATALDELDAEIRSVFTDRELLTPDDVRHGARTLERAVTRRGWPTLAAARGKLLFLMDNGPGPIRDAYRAGGHAALQGRVLFTNSTPGQPDAAFVERNHPRGPNLKRIRSLVRRGYFVRTRADEPLTTVLSGDTTQRHAAFASGAQMVSTDFPVPGMAARYDSDYVARLRTPARCDPVNAPRGCRTVPAP